MNERIKQIIEYYGLSVRAFEQKIFVTEGLIYRGLSRNSDFGSSVIAKILNNCSDISTEWLVLGKGEMLRKNAQISENSQPKPYDPDSEPSAIAAEGSSWPSSDMKPPRRKTLPQPQPQPIMGCPWERYDRAMSDINSLHEEIGSLRERLTQASATIASLKVQLDNQREKTPSPSATTATEPILV